MHLDHRVSLQPHHKPWQLLQLWQKNQGRAWFSSLALLSQQPICPKFAVEHLGTRRRRSGARLPPCWPFLPWIQRGLLASIHGFGKMLFSESLEEEINSFVLHYIRLLNPHTINENSSESMVISSEIYYFVEISCVAITFF